MKWRHSRKELRKIYMTAEVPWAQMGLLVLLVAVLVLRVFGVIP